MKHTCFQLLFLVSNVAVMLLFFLSQRMVESSQTLCVCFLFLFVYSDCTYFFLSKINIHFHTNGKMACVAYGKHIFLLFVYSSPVEGWGEHDQLKWHKTNFSIFIKFCAEIESISILNFEISLSIFVCARHTLFDLPLSKRLNKRFCYRIYGNHSTTHSPLPHVHRIKPRRTDENEQQEKQK